MAAESWMVIVNPKAGSGRGLKDWPVISNLMYNSGLKFTCVFTEHKFHAIELTVSAVNNGYRHIVAVGGDGTIHEVVNGIFIQKAVSTTDIFLAVIPTGTGNDWIRMYGISATYSEAVEALVQKILGNALGGFTTVILLLLIASSLIMISLGIIGFYIARIYEELKGRPRYIISRVCGREEAAE